MGCHRDDGTGLNPVVSISLDNSTNFLVKHPQTNEQFKILLESGDVVIFGGQSRYMLHSVGCIIYDLAPELQKIIGDVRLNFTFRYWVKKMNILYLMPQRPLNTINKSIYYLPDDSGYNFYFSHNGIDHH